MVESDLKRLVKEGAIMSYAVVAADERGELLEATIRFFPPFDKAKMGERLARAAERAARKLGIMQGRPPSA